MHNRLTSRLNTPGVNRGPMTPGLRNQTATPTRQTTLHSHQQPFTPSFKATSTAVNSQQHSIINLDDVNSKDFAHLTEIMMSLLLNAIQIYNSQQQLPTQLNITSNERTRLQEMVDIFTFAKWMNVVQSVIDSLSAQPPLFWSNLELRLQQSENSQVHGYYFLPLTDIQGLYRFLERAAPNNYSLLLAQIPAVQHLYTLHHPLYKLSNQHTKHQRESDLQQQLSQQQLLQPQQPTVKNTFIDQQGSTLATNLSSLHNNIPSNGFEIDFGASPIPQRRIERINRYDPTTPSYHNTSSPNSNNNNNNTGPTPITPTRNINNNNEVPNHQPPQQPQPQHGGGLTRTPGRPRMGLGTPGRISLRQPYFESQSILNVTQVQQPLLSDQPNTFPSSFSTSSQAINGLEPLPAPTVPCDHDVYVSSSSTTPFSLPQTQPVLDTNPHSRSHQSNPTNIHNNDNNNIHTTSFLQSPLRRRHNHLNTTGNIDMYGNDNFLNNSYLSQTSFGQSTIGTQLGTKTPSLNQTNATIRFQHATTGTMVTVYGYQTIDQEKVLHHLASFGDIKQIQYIQPIQNNHPNPQMNIHNNAQFGRCVVEFFTTEGSNLALSKRCNINGFLIGIVAFSPDHLKSHQIVASIPFTRRAAEKQSLLEQYDMSIAAKNNPISSNVVTQHPKQHVMQNIFDSHLSKLHHPDGQQMTTRDFIGYSIAIILFFFFIIRVFISGK